MNRSKAVYKNHISESGENSNLYKYVNIVILINQIKKNLRFSIYISVQIQEELKLFGRNEELTS